MAEMQGTRREDFEAHCSTPQKDTRSVTPQIGHFQRPDPKKSI
jgi:hypothetical protein